jgi:hypothetical protein
MVREGVLAGFASPGQAPELSQQERKGKTRALGWSERLLKEIRNG